MPTPTLVTYILMLLVTPTPRARSEAKVQLSLTKFLALSWSLRTRSRAPVALKYLAIDSEMWGSRITVGFAATALASTTKGASDATRNITRYGEGRKERVMQ